MKADQRIIAAARAFCAADLAIRAAKRSLRDCEEAVNGDPFTGDSGIPPCWHDKASDQQEWCWPCRDRVRIEEGVRGYRRLKRNALARMRRAVEVLDGE